MANMILDFQSKKEEVVLKRIEEQERIEREENKTIDEFEWSDWKAFFDQTRDMVYTMNKCFSYPELEEWTWRIFTHMIRAVENEKEEIKLHNEEVEQFLSEARKRVRNTE